MKISRYTVFRGIKLYNTCNNYDVVQQLQDFSKDVPNLRGSLDKQRAELLQLTKQRDGLLGDVEAYKQMVRPREGCV